MPSQPDSEIYAVMQRFADAWAAGDVPSKTFISLRVDQDVLEWFKAQGTGYQTRINTVLRAFRDASV